MEKLIKATEIVGINYIDTFKRQGSFGYFEKETYSKDPEFITNSINNREDYKYFDKYGNQFSIDEIENTPEIEKAKNVLKTNGYFVDKLWTVDDVKSIYDCTDKQAHDVLYLSFINEATTEQIRFSITEFAEIENLTKKL